MSMPFFSFIIPVYNIEHYLSECIESIIFQSFEDWEIILVNDNSTDGSSVLCNKYAKVNSKIKVINSSMRIGPGKARNKGLKIAKGNYIYFIDGDDRVINDGLHDIYLTLKNDNFPDMLRVGYTESFGRISSKYWKEFSGIRKEKYQIDVYLDSLKLEAKAGLRAWEFFLKRSIFIDSHIFFNEEKIGEDNDFIVRYFLNAKDISEYGKVFYNWRMRLSGSLSLNYIENWDSLIKSAIILLKYLKKNDTSVIKKKFLIKLINIYIQHFEEIGGAINEDEILQNKQLFISLKESFDYLSNFVYKDGLLLNMINSSPIEGAISYCRNSGMNLIKLLPPITDNKHIIGFPATWQCLQVLSILNRKGYNIKGMLDNDEKKYGLKFNGCTIYNPEFIHLSINDYDNIFIIVYTATSKTRKILAEQLISYGLIEKKHFICITS